MAGPLEVELRGLSVPLNTSRCYPHRRVPLTSYKSLLFHRGDTGSIPVQDAKANPSLMFSSRSDGRSRSVYICLKILTMPLALTCLRQRNEVRGESKEVFHYSAEDPSKV